MQTVMEPELWLRLSHALKEEPPVSIRLNPLKSPTTPENVIDSDGSVPWCPYGVYLNSRPQFTFDPMFHAGAYYVQEASSMFLHTVLSQLVTRPVCMLDLCAAPGGKTTLARSVLPKGSLLFCNEPIRSRAQVLSENIQKWGHPSVVVTSDYASAYQRSGLEFDVILTDVPCSGEGMFRKDPNAIGEWSPSNVEHCWQLQRSIVSDIWPCLKPGGLLIYSTCTFNLKENEENVRWIAETFGAELVPVDTKQTWGIMGSLLSDFTAPVYRFIPGLTRGEGLFMAVLRKNGEIIENTSLPEINRKQLSRLNVLFDGPKPSIQKGKDLLPDISEALSVNPSTIHYLKVDVERDTAVAYLRRESITLPSDTPHGIVVLTYRGLPLGFCKNIGRRANNLYPQEWRIRRK